MTGTDAEKQSALKRFGSRLLSAALFLAIGYALFQLLAPQTIGETARRKLLSQLRSHYPGLSISIRRGSYVTGTGLVFEDIEIADPKIDGSRFRPKRMVRVDRLIVVSDIEPAKLLKKEIPMTTRRIVVDGLQADAWLDPDGRFSLEQLLPFPVLGPACPRIDFYNTSIRLSDLATRSRPIEVDLQQVASRNVPTSDGGIDKQIVLVGQTSFSEKITAKIRSAGGQTRAAVTMSKAHFSRQFFDSLPQQYQKLVKDLQSLDCVADIDTDIRYRNGGTLHHTTNVKVHDGRFMHPRLPVDVSQIRGSLTCTPEGITLGPSQAMLGDSYVRFKGRIGGLNWPCSLAINVNAEGLMLSDGFTAILPEKLQSDWKRLQPVGRIDVDGEFVYSFGHWSTTADIDCKGVDVRYDRFPYPVQQLVGSIKVADNIAQTDLLTGRIGDQKFNAAFRLPLKPEISKERSFAMNTAGPIAIDEKLLSALTPLGQTESSKLEKFMRSLRPGGNLRVRKCIVQTRIDGTKSQEFDFEVTQGRLRYERFPLPLHNANGRILIRDDVVSIEDFNADNSGSGRIHCQGVYRLADFDFGSTEPANKRDSGPVGGYKISDVGIHPSDPKAMELKINVHQIPLDASLRSALPEATQFVWDAISPGGTLDSLDVTLSQQLHGQPLNFQLVAKQETTATVTNRSLTIRPEALPYRLDITGGVVTFDGREVLIRSLQARHDASAVSASGRCVQDSTGRWVLALNLHSGSRLHPDAELIAALPDEMRAAVRQLQIRGPLSLRGITSIMMSDQKHPEPVVDWDLRVQLEGNRIGDVGPVHSLRGELDVQGRRDATRLLARGRVRIDSMNINDLQITGLEGPFLINDDQLLLGRETRTFRSPNGVTVTGNTGENATIQGNVFGGSMEFDGRMRLSSGGFNVGMLVRDAQVRTLLADLGQSNNDWTGMLSGRMTLEGILGDVDLLKGEGIASVTGANLYELPLIVQVFGQLRVTPTEDVAFTNADVAFSMFGDQITFRQLQLWGDLIALHGGGTMKRMRDVDLTFNTRVSPQNIFTRAVRPLRESPYTLWTIEVKGPIDDPTINRRALDGVGQTLERLFPGISSGGRDRPNDTQDGSLRSADRQRVVR